MNKINLRCPICETGSLSSELFNDEYAHNGVQIPVEGLERYRCSECSASPIFPDQIKRNQSTIADAKREFDGLLTGAEICHIRSKLGLSQAVAAQIFGGGNNAFSKYERSEVVQSVPMDRLLRLVNAVPALLPLVASFGGVPANTQPKSSGYVLDARLTIRVESNQLSQGRMVASTGMNRWKAA